MYNLPYYKEKDQELVLNFMKQHPFAMLLGSADNIPVATQIPMLFDERDGKIILLGHMMRKQDHHLAFEKNPNVLVLFTGPHTYVSATLYTDPHQGSTWNYMTVHARGTINFLDEAGLEDALRKLTLHYENHNKNSATIFDNLSVEYRTKMMKSIVGFEITVETLDHVFKLSQNRDKESYEHIVKHLDAQDGDGKQIAEQMKHRSSQLFND